MHYGMVTISDPPPPPPPSQTTVVCPEWKRDLSDILTVIFSVLVDWLTSPLVVFVARRILYTFSLHAHKWVYSKMGAESYLSCHFAITAQTEFFSRESK